MSVVADGPEAQNTLFVKSSSNLVEGSPSSSSHSSNLILNPSDRNASNTLLTASDRTFLRLHRLAFPPTYALVGIYRLFTDPNLYVPAWRKCQNGTVRGVIVGGIWCLTTYGIQKFFVGVFMRNSPKVTGLANDRILGYPIPFDVDTYATLLLLTHQASSILWFFLSRNIRIARDRAWEQTVLSRGKGDDFWKGVVEESEEGVDKNGATAERPHHHETKWYERAIGVWLFKRVLFLPLSIYPPLAPLSSLITAWFRGMGMARRLHQRYFASKKMTPAQVEVWMEERRWGYRAFGFTAALLESLPLLGLVFMISNRVGAAMWAFDLEKRQHYIKQRRAELQLDTVNGQDQGKVRN